MAIRRAASASPSISQKATRQQLERILSSAAFQQAGRLKRFLNFIVLESIEGRGDELKEYVVGVQVFGKEPSFDPRTDPIVRVQARRLRARLERYYRDEGQQDEVVVELPKGGYAPVARRREERTTSKQSLGAAFASRNTIAVLPFADHSPAEDLGYFCQGISQEVIHALARFRGLRVLASNSAHGNQRADLREVASGLDAAMIVTGSVRRSGEQLRITIQLVDAASGSYLWSEAIDAAISDAFTAQDQVARILVTRLQPELFEEPESRARRQPTANLAAHNLYLQGRYHLNQRTEEGLQKAVDFFEKAIIEDPHYALAHSGLSDAYALLAHYGVLQPTEVWTKAASSAASAVMLDGNAAEAHTSLAHMKSTQDWDWAGSEREFQRAIALNPRYPTAHHWYAMSCLVPLGRLDDAQEQIETAQSLDPVSSIIARDVGLIHLYRGDLDAALDQCDHTIELNPHFSPAYLTLGVVQEQRGDHDEAVAALQRAVQLSPQTPRMHAALARMLARSGKRDAARTILKKLEAQAKARYVSPFEFATIHFALGEDDAGVRWLNRACKDKCFEIMALKVDPRFSEFRDDKRFAAVMRQVGLR